MAERISGFYKSLDNIVGTLGIQTKLTEESFLLKSELRTLTALLDTTTKSLTSTTQDRDFIRKDYTELVELKSELIKQKEKITKIFKEKFSSMQKEVTDIIESRDYYKSKHEEAEKKYVDVTEEFKKFRQKMKLKYSSVQDKEEKFCRNCQKSFFESENFNWSCRTHSSKLTGDVYWCCGKTGKDSIGCIVSKHLSKGDDDVSDSEKNGVSTKFCSVINE